SLSRGGFASLAIGLAVGVPVFGLRGRSPWRRAVSVAAVVALGAAAALGVRYTSSVRSLPAGSVPSVRFKKPRPADVEYADGRAAHVRVAGFDNATFHVFEEGAEKRVSVETAQVSRVVFAPRAAGLSEGWKMGDAIRFERRRRLADGSARTIGRSLHGDVLRWENGVWTARVYNPLMNRVAGHALWKAWAGAENGAAFRAKLHDAFWYSFDRGQYIGSALRAWKSNPVWGIGPGQHSNRWAEFEATPDGVRPDPDGPADAFKRPRQRDYSKHLYEVHSDWTQLLEEYGLAGLVLFLLPAGAVMWILADRQRSVAEGDGPALARALPLGALLYCIVLILHSFGDFSLQMPSIVWLFSFVLSCAVLENGLDEDRSAPSGSRSEAR
ncbi:MAG: O-antigen ligase family protein, partial [Kiritimatiellae bacterium]|nr:O-antigen ligase family protein [Kiritimatiellia bacterium]